MSNNDKIYIPVTPNEYEEFKKWKENNYKEPIARVLLPHSPYGCASWINLYSNDEVIKMLKKELDFFSVNLKIEKGNSDSWKTMYEQLSNKVGILGSKKNKRFYLF